MKIFTVKTITPELVQDLAALLQEFAPHAPVPTADYLQMALAAPQTKLLVAEIDGHAVGMLNLVIMPLVTGCTAVIHNVAVLENHRRQKIGQALLEAALAEARAMGAVKVELTSHAGRTAARALYQKLGFEGRDTTLFRLDLA